MMLYNFYLVLMHFDLLNSAASAMPQKTVHGSDHQESPASAQDTRNARNEGGARKKARSENPTKQNAALEAELKENDAYDAAMETFLVPHEAMPLQYSREGARELLGTEAETLGE
jgi:hypothetical protein